MIHKVAFRFVAKGLRRALARPVAQRCRRYLVHIRVVWASHMSKKLAVEGRWRIECWCMGVVYSGRQSRNLF